MRARAMGWKGSRDRSDAVKENQRRGEA